MSNKINANDIGEVWRDAVGFPGYRVSNTGRVVSVPRTVIRSGTIVRVSGRFMSTILNKGYPRVTMRADGKTRYVFVHQLVAAAFIGPCPQGAEVRHKNGDRTDARLENLEYGTRAQNIADCKRHGTFKNGASHLTEDLVRAIASRHTATAAALAQEFGVSPSTITGIRTRRQWAHLKLDLRSTYRRTGREHPHKTNPERVRRGSQCSHAILNEADVRDILTSSESAPSLAKRFNVTRDAIYNIRKGKTWKHVPRP